MSYDSILDVSVSKSVSSNKIQLRKVCCYLLNWEHLLLNSSPIICIQIQTRLYYCKCQGPGGDSLELPIESPAFSFNIVPALSFSSSVCRFSAMAVVERSLSSVFIFTCCFVVEGSDSVGLVGVDLELEMAIDIFLGSLL